MDERKKYSIPEKWVDRIFEIMEEIYKEQWTEWQGSERNKAYYKTIWSTGLYGLTVDDIKYGLMVCRNSQSKSTPPHVIDFYHYAKKIKNPILRPPVQSLPVGDRAFAKQSIAQIRSILK